MMRRKKGQQRHSGLHRSEKELPEQRSVTKIPLLLLKKNSALGWMLHAWMVTDSYLNTINVNDK
jgi:hypothetical protein